MCEDIVSADFFSARLLKSGRCRSLWSFPAHSGAKSCSIPKVGTLLAASRAQGRSPSRPDTHGVSVGSFWFPRSHFGSSPLGSKFDQAYGFRLHAEMLVDVDVDIWWNEASAVR